MDSTKSKYKQPPRPFKVHSLKPLAEVAFDYILKPSVNRTQMQCEEKSSYPNTG